MRATMALSSIITGSSTTCRAGLPAARRIRSLTRPQVICAITNGYLMTMTSFWVRRHSDLNNRVIYNMQGRFAGSPAHQEFDAPAGNLCHYKWIFNDDDKFLGATSFNKIHQPGNSPGDDPSIQREQLANTFLRALGVPW